MGNLMKISTRRSCSIATEHIENIQCFITEATINVSFSIAMSQDQMASLPSGNLLHSYWTWPSRNSERSHSKWWFSVVLLFCQRVIIHELGSNQYDGRGFEDCYGIRQDMVLRWEIMGPGSSLMKMAGGYPNTLDVLYMFQMDNVWKMMIWG